MIRKYNILFLALFLLALSNRTVAQTTTPASIIGFTPTEAQKELQNEELLKHLILPIRLDTLVRRLSAENRVAGSVSDERARDYVLSVMKQAGIPTEVFPYTVYLPYATKVELELLDPKSLGIKKQKFTLEETPVAGETNDPKTAYPWANGYTGSGDVTTEFVYVNFGLPDDYRELDSVGISVKGKIAIARYGKSYRGIKAKVAEEHGAAGLLLFSDPSGDGYVLGDVYPKGPMRPDDGVQRGSIYNGHGDPTTLGNPSTESVAREPLESAQKLSKIPVMPISYKIAQTLFADLRAGNIPSQSWQGALPLRYHTGPSTAKLHLAITTDGIYRTIWNTVSKIEGSVWPAQWIIVGGHRDAWGPGAEDNGSGCASVIAAAEAFAKLSAQGIRPKRTILFCTWDAEEWGLIGSTEWVEEHERELNGRCIAYINQDECATGKTFGSGADPSFHEFIWQVTKSVENPDGGSIYDRWKESLQPIAPAKVHAGLAEPEIGLLGGGSDFSSFANHLGLPCIEHGFGGPFGEYHSMHDCYNWTRHFGDSTFAFHAASSKLVAVEAMRLANAELLPFDFEELGIAINQFSIKAARLLPPELYDSLEFRNLDTTLAMFRAAGSILNKWRDEKCGVRSATYSADTLYMLNFLLRKVFFDFTILGGLDSDSWVRNTIVISDPENGYADLTLPEIQLAIRSHDLALVRKKVELLIGRLERATNTILRVTLSIRNL
jgi:N-acetylated-alpha-linked acidic dipeptidase